MMQDEKIVALFWQRDESAIRETDRKYGSYLYRIALNILNDRQDSRESVNDTYFKVWNTIPPHRPAGLSSFLGRIARQTAIDRYRKSHRQKRGEGQYALSLTELEECLSPGDSTADEVDAKLLGEAIGRFLSRQKPQARTAFVCRYYFADSIGEIASAHGMSRANVSTLLHRTRLALREHLEKEGFSL